MLPTGASTLTTPIWLGKGGGSGTFMVPPQSTLQLLQAKLTRHFHFSQSKNFGCRKSNSHMNNVCEMQENTSVSIIVLNRACYEPFPCATIVVRVKTRLALSQLNDWWVLVTFETFA